MLWRRRRCEDQAETLRHHRSNEKASDRIFAAQEFGRDAGLQMFPGQVFVHAAGPGEFIGGQAAFFQGFQPGGQIETFDPAGEDAALAVDLFHHIGQTAVSAGKDAFQMAHGRFVPAQLEELLALEFVAHHLHTALDLFLADLFHPLEGREGLGHEGRERRRDLQARIALARGVAHLAAKVGASKWRRPKVRLEASRTVAT